MKTALAAAALLVAAPLFAQDAPVILVNGKAITQSAVTQRLWKLNGPQVLDTMIQEELLRQSADKLGVKANKEETDRRLKRVREQFSDEAKFLDSLKRNGSTVEDLRAQIEAQVLREDLVTKAKNISVSDDEVKSYFDANKDKLGSPESVRIRHLLVAGEQQAHDLQIALKAGADFGKLADELSLDSASKGRGGDLGFIPRGMIVPEIEKAAFALKPGEISDVIKTNLGFHIVKVEEVKAAEPANFKKIKDDLKKALVSSKINAAWPEFLKSLSDAAKIENPKEPAPAAAAPAPAAKP